VQLDFHNLRKCVQKHVIFEKRQHPWVKKLMVDKHAGCMIPPQYFFSDGTDQWHLEAEKGQG
jgi:hypothetical protein